MRVDYKEIGKRIALRRHKLGLRQSEVNEKAGLSDKYLSHIETARTKPSIEVLMRICDALDTTPDYILLGSIEHEDSSYSTLQEKLRLVKGAKKEALISEFINWVIDQDI